MGDRGNTQQVVERPEHRRPAAEVSQGLEFSMCLPELVHHDPSVAFPHYFIHIRFPLSRGKPGSAQNQDSAEQVYSGPAKGTVYVKVHRDLVFRSFQLRVVHFRSCRLPAVSRSLRAPGNEQITRTTVLLSGVEVAAVHT